jgi:hypothetical protein
MPSTFVKIASVAVGSAGASTIDFTSIPQTFTDLCIKLSLRNSNASVSNWYNINFNGVTTNRSRRSLYADGSAFASYTGADGEIGVINGSSGTANVFSNQDIYILNYTSSNFKSVTSDSVTENNATNATQLLTAFLWSSTAAITSITLSGTNNFVQYSTATLYGIKKS